MGTTEKTPAQVRAFDAVDAQDAAGHQSTLITVGARLYPSLAKKHGLRSYQCSHATGLFAYKIRRGRRPALRIHTGHIDSTWRLLKQSLPHRLASKSTKTGSWDSNLERTHSKLR